MSVSDPIVLISVVRDFETYARCIRNNPNVNCHELVCLNNSVENKGIPFRYNEFLNGYDFTKPAWFIFCHEDFEVTENITDIFHLLPTDKLYGPIGVLTKLRFGVYYQWCLLGHIIGSNRKGEAVQEIGTPVPVGTPVETFDCQCLIVHSELIAKTKLRFDENLSFDLYIEDFCIQAKETHHLASVILPFKCHHWSDSLAVDRYYVQADYLSHKYPNCCYTGTSSHSIGTPGFLRRLSDHLKTIAWHVLSVVSKK